MFGYENFQNSIYYVAVSSIRFNYMVITFSLVFFVQIIKKFKRIQEISV